MQRDAITKERQARMATGGGPEQPKASIDPDVAVIAPHLMKTAPVAFTSNMMDEEITGIIFLLYVTIIAYFFHLILFGTCNYILSLFDTLYFCYI